MKRTLPKPTIALLIALLATPTLARPPDEVITATRDIAEANAPEDTESPDNLRHYAVRTGGGCVAGAIAGTVVPGVGNAVGCVIGALGGWLFTWMQEPEDLLDTDE